MNDDLFKLYPYQLAALRAQFDHDAHVKAWRKHLAWETLKHRLGGMQGKSGRITFTDEYPRDAKQN